MPVDSLDVEQKPEENFPVPTSVIQESFIAPEEVAEDFILRTVEEDDSPDNVLRAVMGGLAEEQAALRILRKNKQTAGKDVSGISMKRGTLLKYMSDTIIQRKAISGTSDDLNLKGLKFREVFKLFLSVISKTFDEVKIPPEFKELFFQKLSYNLEGWEEKAEKVVKSIESPK